MFGASHSGAVARHWVLEGAAAVPLKIEATQHCMSDQMDCESEGCEWQILGGPAITVPADMS